MESSDRLDAYLHASQGNPAGAATAALADVEAAALRIADLAKPYDAFDVLESVRLVETLHDPETYMETEWEGSPAVIEICALVLAARGQRAGTLPNEDRHRARADGVIDEIRQECSTAVAIGSLIPLLQLAPNASAVDPLQLRAVLREVFVRNMSYVHMVEDTLGALFDEPTIATACTAVFGCTVSAIRATFAALNALHEREWQARFDALRQLAELMPSESASGAESPDQLETSANTRERALALLEQAWSDPADASTFTPEAIAAEAGLDPNVVKRVVELFSYSMEARDPAEATREFLWGRSALRNLPILSDPEGSSVVVHDALLVPTIRGRVEQLLKDTAYWERYARHRAHYLESEALRLLEGIFGGCTTYRAFEYFVPDPDSLVPETSPERYSKLVEGDGLMILDDVAVILEAKSGALADASRSGDANRLVSDLRKIVTDAADQAERMRALIDTDRGLRLGNGTWLDLDCVREVHAIAVSLDDLSGIATVTSELVLSGLLASSHLPWTVSLHDLRVVTELVDRPSELLLYLRRRTEPDVTRRFHASDELDLFLEFFSTGLYVEPDPDRVRAELPQFGEPSVATKRRFRNQRLTFLLSQTDRLDAWYAHRLGLRQAPAAKPKLNANPQLCGLVDFLEEQGADGWLRVGTALLDASGPLQRKFAQLPQQLVQLTHQDHSPHTMAILGGTRANDGHVLVWASTAPDQSKDQAANQFTRYVSAKKHQLQLAFGAGLLFDGADPSTPCFTYYDNRRPGPDTALDRAVVLLGLHTGGRRSIVLPRVSKRGRSARRR